MILYFVCYHQGHSISLTTGVAELYKHRLHVNNIIPILSSTTHNLVVFIMIFNCFKHEFDVCGLCILEDHQWMDVRKTISVFFISIRLQNKCI